MAFDFDALHIEPERAAVELLMLANWAEIVNQLIYVMGGGGWAAQLVPATR